MPKKNRSVAYTKKKMERLRVACAKLQRENTELRARIELLELQKNTLERSEFWRATKPFRAILDFCKRMLAKTRAGAVLRRGMAYLKQNGLRATLRRILEYRRAEKRVRLTLSPQELDAQRAFVFPRRLKISILVPLYNTPIAFLREMIRSVQVQTYAAWELCLADGSDATHADVEAAVRTFSRRDTRIHYRRLTQNLGISENTNACMQMATGDYFALLDHDDLLHPSALFEVMRAICERDADLIYTDEITFSKSIRHAYSPHHKPDFSPDLLRSYNYICHLTVFSRALAARVGGFRSAFNGSQDYDLILRLSEAAERIVHIPKILYYWRAHRASVASSVAAKPYALTAARMALEEHLERVGLRGEVLDGRIPSTYRIRYFIEGRPLISIVIPNMDHADILSRCIDSIQKRSTYRNFEILIVENNSRKKETARYYASACRRYSNVRVIRWAHEFNYSKINNFALPYVKGDYVIFLNNDVEILTPSWMQELLMLGQRPDVGAVGMMLYYPDDTVQHAGVILGIGGVAGHSHKYYRRGAYGYMSRMALVQNLSAVTAAAMMVRRAVLDEVGGFDPRFAVAFNDVDLCMRIRRAGYLNLFTPFAEAYHYESKSRGAEDTPEKQVRFRGEVALFEERWQAELAAGDPYYNPNLTLRHEDFRLR